MKIPRSVWIVPVAVLSLSLSSGCATYRTISTAEQGSSKVFSGTRLDVSAIRGDEVALRKFKADPPRSVLVVLACVLLLPAGGRAAVTYSFDWYCSGCAKIGMGSNGREGPFGSGSACQADSSCESARQVSALAKN